MELSHRHNLDANTPPTYEETERRPLEAVANWENEGGSCTSQVKEIEFVEHVSEVGGGYRQSI